MHFRTTALLCLLLIAPLFAQDTTAFPKPPSIKGLQVQMNDDALALGIHHAGININIAGLVDALIYHRHVDHAHEGGLRLGLWRNAPNSIADPHSKKRIWELFRAAGTPDWAAAAAPLLSVTGLKSWNELTGE